MVTATSPQGTVNLESTIEITEGQREAIKKNRKKFENALKDFGVTHTIAVNEDGTIFSKIGMSMQNAFNPVREGAELVKAHDELIALVTSWINNGITEDAKEEQLNNEHSNEEEMPRYIGIIIPLADLMLYEK